MFGGSRSELEANLGWELLITDADIEGIPDRQSPALLTGEPIATSRYSGHPGKQAG